MSTPVEPIVVRRVVSSSPNGLRLLEQLECGHTMDSVSPATTGEVPCFECASETRTMIEASLKKANTAIEILRG